MNKRKNAIPTQWNDCTPGSNRIEQRNWSGRQSRAGLPGRTFVDASCAFCSREQRVYLWSLSGGGKRCENKQCLALFGSSGQMFRLIDRGL